MLLWPMNYRYQQLSTCREEASFKLFKTVCLSKHLLQSSTDLSPVTPTSMIFSQLGDDF